MLHEAKHATTAYNREHEIKLSVSQQVVFCLLLYMGAIVYGCVTAGSYAKILLRNGVDKF